MATSDNIYESSGECGALATINQDDTTSADGTSHLNADLTVDCPVLTGSATHQTYTDAAGEEQMAVGLADYTAVVNNLGDTVDTAVLELIERGVALRSETARERVENRQP